MSTPSYVWPEELFSSEEVRAWLSSQLGDSYIGPVRVLHTKQWGVTAEFANEHHARRVVFKGSQHPSAAHGPIVHQFLAATIPESVPAVVARRIDGNTAWTAFEPVDGHPLEARLDPIRFAQLASEFATIQMAAADVPIPSAIPRSPLRSFSTTLDRVGESIRHHRDEWALQGSGPQARSGRNVVDVLASVRPQVDAAVEDLADARWPDSIDHVDLNVTNVIVLDGRLVLIDWEEAVVGFPACSLDRLLDDARDYDRSNHDGVSPTGAALIDAYVSRIPWGSPDDRADVVSKAVRLNRVAFAGQALDFWRARGRPFGHPKLMAFCVERILEAWPTDW